LICHQPGHALDVTKAGDPRKWDWIALMIDVPSDELKHCVCRFAWLYIHPDDYKPDGSRMAREVFVRIPGKHRNKDTAWAALEDLIATRHNPASASEPRLR
jgi:hypothetical protein